MRKSNRYPQPSYPHPAPAARQPAQRGPAVRRIYRKRPAQSALFRWFPVILLGLLMIAAALAPYAYFQIFQRILPGVWVGKTHLGGMSIAAAERELEALWSDERPIHAADGIGAYQLTAAQIGLSVDARATAWRAFEFGHQGNFTGEYAQMLQALISGTQVAPVVVFDPQAARLSLEALATQTTLPPKDATIRIENGAPVAVPGELGYTLNLDASLANIAADPTGVLLSGYLPLQLMPLAPAIQDVSPAIAQAEALLATPPTIFAYDPVSDETLQWPVASQELASWLTVESGPEGPHVSVDPARVSQHIDSLSASLAPERSLDVEGRIQALADALETGADIGLRVRHNPTRYTVAPGDTLLKISWRVGIPFWRILDANPSLNPDNILAGQELVIPSKDDLLPLPLVPSKRVVISIGEQRLWVYENGQQQHRFVISTGIDRSPTQPGVFQVQTHEPESYASVWDLYMPNFLGIYEAWPGFMNGLHGLPTLSNGRRLWANILGRPASYGCIILDLDDAEWLYNWAENGVIVEIKP